MTHRAPIVLALLGALGMAGLIAYALGHGSFFEEGRMLYAFVWGKVTLADLYLGFGLFSSWVIFREHHLGRSVACIALVLTLGNAFAYTYVLVALVRCRGDWARFWLGHRSDLLRR